MNNADLPAMPCKGSIDRNKGEIRPYQFGNDDFVFPGMTKREHYAGLALMGLVAARGQHDVTDAKEIVEDAVTFADALLAELGREAT